MEDGFSDQKPSKAVSKVFPKNWFYKPWDLSKTQSFYQSVLETIGYVKIKHFRKDEKNPHPSYSTCTL